MTLKLLPVLVITSLFIVVLKPNIVAQESLEKYAYSSPDLRKIFRVHDNKKLNNDEILVLMKNDKVAQDKFKKSLKLKKMALITGGIFIGITGYVATQDDIKNNTFSDYNTGQKVLLVGFTATTAGFIYSLLGSGFARQKSIARLCLPCKAEELDKKVEQQNNLSLSYYGTGIGLIYSF